MAKRECPLCKEKVQEKATICKHCKNELPPLPPRKWYQSWKGLLLIFFILWVLVTVFGGGPNKQPTNNTSVTSKAVTQPANAWIYGEYKDEMRGTVTKYATKKSINTVDFGFPYQGVQNGTIYVSKSAVLFYVEKGQVICHGDGEYGTCTVLVKFDDGKAKSVKARKSGDDSTTISMMFPRKSGHTVKLLYQRSWFPQESEGK